MIKAIKKYFAHLKKEKRIRQDEINPERLDKFCERWKKETGRK